MNWIYLIGMWTAVISVFFMAAYIFDKIMDFTYFS